MTIRDPNRTGTGAETPDARLDRAFAEARVNAPEMPGALAARMFADAYEMQPAPEEPGAAGAGPSRVRRQPFAARVIRFLGGWSVATGLGLASVLGMTIGYSGPDMLPGLFDGAVIEAELSDDSDPYETLLAELGS